jgi:hypothetical protein
MFPIYNAEAVSKLPLSFESISSVNPIFFSRWELKPMGNTIGQILLNN